MNTIERNFISYRPQSKGLSYQEVGAELRKLEEKYPDTTELVTIGETPEGREIQALRIFNGSEASEPKPGVIVTEDRYARDKAQSVDATLDLARDLLEARTEEIGKLFDDQEVWLIPLTNPDGYENSRGSDSFWRKNRRPVGSEGHSSLGVDLNRNYSDDFLLATPVKGGSSPEEQVLNFALSRENIHSMISLVGPIEPLKPWAV